MIRFTILIFFFGSLFFIACDKQKTEKQVRLSYNERREKDTLYRAEIERLAPILDSLCDISKDSLLKKAVDSIKQVRKQEEIKLLNRTIKEE